MFSYRLIDLKKKNCNMKADHFTRILILIHLLGRGPLCYMWAKLRLYDDVFVQFMIDLEAPL